MGSVMQKQAVPGIKKAVPLVSTGLESQIAMDSGQVILARNDGKVIEIDSSHIVIETKDKKRDEYMLKNFVRTNQNTCVHETPIIKLNEEVKKGQALADSSSTKDGQLALGHDLLVAYMP
jgi:DNA-directed RNA polymerase subunit beta